MTIAKDNGLKPGIDFPVIKNMQDDIIADNPPQIIKMLKYLFFISAPLTSLFLGKALSG